MANLINIKALKNMKNFLKIYKKKNNKSSNKSGFLDFGGNKPV